MLKYESKFELNVVTESITEGFLTLDSCNFGTDNFEKFECNWFPQFIRVICNDYFRDSSFYEFCNFSCINWEIAKLAIWGEWWDGSNSHRWRQCHMPAYAFDFEMAQNSKHLFFSYFLLEILITFGRNGSLVIARKNWDGSKFEEKFNSRQKWFAILK